MQKYTAKIVLDIPLEMGKFKPEDQVDQNLIGKTKWVRQVIAHNPDFGTLQFNIRGDVANVFNKFIKDDVLELPESWLLATSKKQLRDMGGFVTGKWVSPKSI